MPFDEDEVIKALLDCFDKVPGLDGTTMTFIQPNWNTVIDDVMRMFAEFSIRENFWLALMPLLLV